jgi:AcrR family transcriptional regulator
VWEEGDVGATRRRGEQLEATILEATWAEIMEHGYPRLTMEGVAARAHTGKQVIYRRWPTRAQLTIAAIRHTQGALVPVAPDTGSLREDVLIVLRRMAARARQYTPDLFFGLLAEVPDLEEDNFLTILPGVIGTILRQAVARGELTHADLPPRVVSLPVDLIRYEGLRHGGRWDDAVEGDVEPVLVAVVDDVFLPLVTALAGPAGR